MEKCCLLVCFPYFDQHNFNRIQDYLVDYGTTHRRLALALLCQFSIEENTTTDMTTVQSDEDNASVEVYSCQTCLDLCQID